MDGTVHDIWKTVDAGDGYYYLFSGISDGNTYVLDVKGKSTGNGTSMEINKFKEGEETQQFYMSDNLDGSYIIKTKISGNNSAVEIKYGDLNSGAIIQQCALNSLKNQNWIFEEVESPTKDMKLEQSFILNNIQEKKNLN